MPTPFTLSSSKSLSLIQLRHIAPAEVLLTIFAFLPTKDLYNVCLTCKDWCTVATKTNQLWKPFGIDRVNIHECHVEYKRRKKARLRQRKVDCIVLCAVTVWNLFWYYLIQWVGVFLMFGIPLLTTSLSSAFFFPPYFVSFWCCCIGLGAHSGVVSLPAKACK